MKEQNKKSGVTREKEEGMNKEAAKEKKSNDREEEKKVKDKAKGKKSEEWQEKEGEKDPETVKQDEKEDLQEKLEESWNKYVRLSAEFDNYRKRTLKEKSELLKMAGEDIIKSILPVIDDFERAIETMDNTGEVDALKEGVTLIYTKLLNVLESKGLKEIQAINEEFDTDYHEAVTKIPAPDEKQKGKVVDVVQKGYTLNSKVIRYSKVVVGE